MRWAVWLLWPMVLGAQSTISILIEGRSIPLLPPAVDRAGQTVVFGSAITPEGATFPTTDLYIVMSDGTALRRLTQLAGGTFRPQGATAVSLAPDASRAVFTWLVRSADRAEEVHTIELATGVDRTVAVDREGCIQPLCPSCFLTCVNTPHLFPDGSKVLYSTARQQPFYVASTAGAGVARLPIYSGALAPGPQRVISRNGLVVFTSSAPAGPTFAASAWDVYLMRLDGSNIQPVTKFGNDPSIFSFNAAISADGSTIAFECNRDPDSGKPDQTTRVWVAHSDGTGLRALTTGTEPSTAPSISADGGLVAFVHKGQIYTARSDGTALQALTSFQMSSAQDPAISDDGSRVAFTAGPKSFGRGAIYTVSSGGGDLRALYAPHALSPGGVVGAADFFSAPSPGSLLTAYGTNLAGDRLTTASRFPLPESLAGVSLLVNGRPAPVLAVTPWQVNAQLPPEIPEGPAAFQFHFDDGTPSAPGAADVKSFAPAIFSSGNFCQAAALHGGTGILADQDHPASAGEALEIYGIGLGPTDPIVRAGVPAPASPPARAFTPQVLIGGRPAGVLFAGLAPGLAGVYQVNAIVPPSLQPGGQYLEWRAGDAGSMGCATIWVK
ncbi:MAG: PD40 domain-containing protein [Acidobacteria bacterium]|nr:PD40 domain-containing protein [Acidobacteriota bacterium]